MKTSSITSIVAACLSAGGAMTGYILLRPSNLGKYLEWQGLKLATKDDDFLWKSIYEENKENFKDVFAISSDTVEIDFWKKIKEYCIQAFAKTDYSSDIQKANKWCIDNVQTVKGQLIRDGNNIDDLMTKSAEYETATAVQGNEDFWKFINSTSEDLTERSKAYQVWCETSLKANPKEALVKNVNNFCRKKPYSNFQEKLKHEGYRRLSPEEIDKKYTELNIANLGNYTGSNLLEEIGEGPQSWTSKLGIKEGAWKVNEGMFKKQYKKYCEDGDKLTFSEKGNYPDKYSKYRGICAVEENPKKKD